MPRRVFSSNLKTDLTPKASQERDYRLRNFSTDRMAAQLADELLREGHRA
jgi:hypothetical protein